MIFSPIFWIFVGTIAVYWYFTRKDNPGKGLKKIPGPKPLPIIGNAHQLDKEFHKTLTKWTEEYGEIYQMSMLQMKNIVISNPKWMKEFFSQDPNFVGRPNMADTALYEGEQLGIVNAEGELWEVHRRFLLRQLRDFGFGKSAMQGLIMEELQEVIERFKEQEGKPISNIKKTLTLAVINSLWTVISQKRFKHDDPVLLKLVDLFQKLMDDFMEAGVLAFLMPLTKHIFPEWSGYNKARRVMEENKKWFVDQLEQRKSTYQDGVVRDFIDVYLAEVKKTTDPNSVFYGAKAERQLIATLSDLFFAGSDTTSSTLSWSILYLCKNPEVQKKFQEEITAVTNNSRNVSVEDRPNMPYALALIDEVLRFSSIVPQGVQHRALEGKEFHGYYIPKDALIMANLYFLHHNPEVWRDPKNFRPERFLSKDEKKYQKSDNLLPFQIGRRQCVGETLARDTIFLFVTNLFQRFTFSFDPSQPEPPLDPKPSFLLQPYNYSVIVKDRMSS